MAVQQIPLVGASFLAALEQTGLAASKLHLFTTDYTPTVNDILANLTAIEATFSGYTAGGYALTTWTGPFFSSQGGVQINSPQIVPTYVPPMSTPVGNTVTGWYLVDATGNLVADGKFDQGIVMDALGDGFTITLALIVGSLNALVECWVNGVMQ